MTSVVSLRAFANSASVPVLVPVDMQQEYLAKPRLLALPEADAALANCRRLVDHARRIGLPVAFVRMVGESAFFNRATPSSAGSKSSCLSTLIDAFHRRQKVTYICDASASHALDELPADNVHRAVSKISGIYTELCEAARWIAATMPRNLGNDKQANGKQGLASKRLE